ncbi:unnamed protein product [Litomosoides sigmodontis]|uniref:SXP/RAL-2 family protein Ani s 5-like cation-binding domain-containing protein n=1 Tax=Litomosoides sigmodontis TaxID=42156 RepID=A0A3P7JS06_LITSI|nr:unnamed protein product [Litomosoides sigmodontis]
MLLAVLFWLFGSYVFRTINCLPDFIKEMPAAKRKEYEALYKHRPKLTRTEFYDLCEDWAERQGAKIKSQYHQYRLDEEQYIAKRDRILRDRLDGSNGSDAAKNYLRKLLDLQSNMDITLKAYETAEEEMRHSVLFDVLQEATELWNLLDAAHID